MPENMKEKLELKKCFKFHVEYNSVLCVTLLKLVLDTISNLSLKLWNEGGTVDANTSVL